MSDDSYVYDPFTPAAAGHVESAQVSPSRDTALGGALDLLRAVVTDYETSGRKPLIAGIKPEMQRRSEGQFSEAALGFNSFREFVETAARAGCVTAVEQERSLLLHVEGVDAKPPARSHGKASSRRRSIRRDLWKAFADWNPALERAWDKQEKIAVISGSGSAEDAENPELGRLREAQPDRFIEIPRITFEVQLGWMMEYGKSLSHAPHGRILVSLLNGDPLPANAFMTYLRRYPELSRDWNMLKTERVRSEIEIWIRNNNLEPDVLDNAVSHGEVLGSHMPPRPASAEAQAEPLGEEDRVRDLVIRAVKRMPLADLLRLQIPVEYMVDSG